MANLLKEQAIEFLTDNEIAYDRKNTLGQLLVIIRDRLEAAGYDPDFYDFASKTELRPTVGAIARGPAIGSPQNSVRQVPTPEFFELEPQCSAATRWTRWLARYDVYADAVGLASDPPATQRSTFLCVAGKEVMDLLPSLVVDPEQTNPYLSARDALGAYFLPKRNKHFERYQFGKMTQLEAETMDAFVARLRQQAKHCLFKDADVEEHILARVIDSVKSDTLRDRFLDRGDELTLNDALRIARNFESVRSQSSVMANRSVARVSTGSNAVGGQKKSLLCKFCSTEHVFKRQFCPARNATCNKCKEVGHYAGSRMCCKSSKGDTQKNEPAKPRKPVRTKKSVRKVEETGEGIDLDDRPDSPDSGSFYVSAISSKSKRSSLHTSLVVAGRKMSFLLDTGSVVNLVPLSAVPAGTKVFGGPQLKQYDGTPLPTIGSVKLPVQYYRNGVLKKVFVTFSVVVDSKDKTVTPLLGNRTTLELGLLTISARNVYRITEQNWKSQWASLVKKHSYVFREEIAPSKV